MSTRVERPRIIDTIASRHGDRQIVRIRRGELLRIRGHEGLHRFLGRWGDYIKLPTLAVLPSSLFAPCSACLLAHIHGEPVPSSCDGCDAMPAWVEDSTSG